MQEAEKQELDAIRGVVETRALVDPTGTIIHTELSNAPTSRFKMDTATFDVLAPTRLSKVVPMLYDGKPIFHWIILPAIRWQ